MTTTLSRRSMLKWMAAGTTTMALSACVVPAPSSESGTDSTPPADQVEIVWSRHGSESDLPLMEGLIDLFPKKILTLVWNDYNTKIPVMVAGDTAPDVIGTHPALMTELYAAEGLWPID